MVQGNEPFAYPAIVNEHKEYEIHGSLAQKIQQEFQGQTITVRGKVAGDFQNLETTILLPELPKLEVLAIIAVE